MKKIATLGPKGTYCDIAVKRFLEDNKLDYEIEYKLEYIHLSIFGCTCCYCGFLAGCSLSESETGSGSQCGP